VTTRFTVAQPRETHFRPATCEEVDCRDYLNGFVIPLNPAVPLHLKLMEDIKPSGRKFRKMRSEDAAEEKGVTLPPHIFAFVFPPGQQCFRPHMVVMDKPPILIHDGRRHATVENYVEDFNESSYRAARLRAGMV